MSARMGACALVGLLLLAGIPAGSAQTDAGSVALGMDYGSMKEATAGGARPQLASMWVGEWTSRTGWEGLDSMLRGSRAAGVTPVVYWYYWGDSISPSCVDHGCDGRARWEWDQMTQALATRIRDNMGGQTVYVVLENEFNKNGITSTSYAWKFDGYLEKVAHEIGAVPGVKVVLGFGAWGEGEWSRFPKSIAASDAIGFQTMRASTRDSEATYRGAPDKVASMLDAVQRVAPGKGALLYDVALSSFPDWRWSQIQDQTLASLLARRAEYAQKGLEGMVYRELRDNPSMGTWNYYGEAEQYWGFKDRWGNEKASWRTWKAALASAPAPAPTAFQATFSPKPGSEWWVETRVDANQWVNGVCASVNGGACQALSYRSWGAWAGSFHVPHGARVVFTATSSTGEKATSGAYAWPGATPAGAAPAPAFSATFRPEGGNEWWVQARVEASQDVRAVCASVNGGACQPLKLQSWGAWAESLRAPAGSKVVLTATSSTGATATSGAFWWPSGAPAGSFAATFRPGGGNEWWVQTSVDANEAVRAVCASVNGGACQPLKLQSWGAWAESLRAPAGSTVVFKATSASGATATSPGYRWPA